MKPSPASLPAVHDEKRPQVDSAFHWEKAVVRRGTLDLSDARMAHGFTLRQARFGTMLFATGLSVLALAAWENEPGLPFAMPWFWHNHRMLCLLVALVIGAFGLYVLSNGPRGEAEERRGSAWRPTRLGRRFRSLVVYSREGCHLCDEATEFLHRYSAYLPPIHEIDIDADPALRSRFDTEVPVVEFDGKVRFKGAISEVLLRRLIEGTAPSEGSES